MNKKQIIQTIVIVGAFGASGYVLYSGLYSKKPTPIVPGALTESVAGLAPTKAPEISIDKILPYGDSLDFDKVLKKQNQQYGVIDYPKLDPNSEVGISEPQLMKVIPPKQVQKK